MTVIYLWLIVMLGVALAVLTFEALMYLEDRRERKKFWAALDELEIEENSRPAGNVTPLHGHQAEREAGRGVTRP